jgi:integrase
VRNTLSAALREALKLEYVTRNVAKLVDPPKYKPPEKSVWTKKQVSQFLKHSKNHRYYPLFLLLFCYGLRRGEAMGLRWEDVDFENKVIRIRQTLSLVNYRPHVGPPKTKASIRDLPMLPAVKTALLCHYEKSKHYADGLVFHAGTGNPVHPSLPCVRNTLPRWMKKRKPTPNTARQRLRCVSFFSRVRTSNAC